MKFENKIKVEIEREQLIKIKETNYEAYEFIISCSKGEEVLYCESLDINQLKDECAKGYFQIEDLFTKEQIKEGFTSVTGISIELGTSDLSDLPDLLSKFKTQLKDAYAGIIKDAVLESSKELYDPSMSPGNITGLPLVDKNSMDMTYDPTAKADPCKYPGLRKAIEEREPFKMEVDPSQVKTVIGICDSVGLEHHMPETQEVCYLFLNNLKPKYGKGAWMGWDGKENWRSFKNDRARQFYLETDSFEPKEKLGQIMNDFKFEPREDVAELDDYEKVLGRYTRIGHTIVYADGQQISNIPDDYMVGSHHKQRMTSLDISHPFPAEKGA